MKQKKWWKENAPDKLYEFDWEIALMMHAASWSFMIHLPIAIANSFDVGFPFLISFIINMIIHAFIDDQKANRHKINLLTDQTIHLMQIGATLYLLWNFGVK